MVIVVMNIKIIKRQESSMKKFCSKVLAALLTICMLVGVFAIPTVATDDTATTETIVPDTSWYTGEEAQEVVYSLYDAADLLGFAALGNSGVTFKGVTVKLMADIDLNPGWNATTVVNGKEVTLANAPKNVWNSIPTFEGVLDGNGHTISGIYSKNTPAIPTSGFLAVGGFIDRVVKGEIKDLIVLNSLSLTAPVQSSGTIRLNAGGFIGHCEDATLKTLYVDMDAWLKFDYHANFGGMISSMGTSGSSYAGKIENIVFAGTVGAISNTSNDYTTSGSRSSDKHRFGGVIAASQEWMGTNDIKLAIKNLAFTGALYWPGMTSGDDIICYTSGGAYNVGFGVDNVGNYYYYESGGTVDLPTGATDINATATNIFNNKNAANYGNANDTYADAGWVEVEHTNGLGLSKILLPGSVVDMLNDSDFVADMNAANVKVDADNSWYTGDENKEVIYYLYDAADLLGFAEVAADTTFFGATVKLMENIDLNPGWNATTVVNGKEVTLAEAPANVWTSIPTFEGILDGNGKTVSGIYSYNTPSIPASPGIKAVGGFIDRIVKGEIKNLIVRNSLSVTAPTSGFGSTRLNAGGFIGHCEDSTLKTLYIDMDAWIKFDYHANFGGMISAMGTTFSAYNGEVEDIVFAGTVGAITPTSNEYTATGNRSTKYRFGGMVAGSIDWMGTKDIKFAMKNVAFTGALYWPGNASGDDVICYTSGGSYNVGFGVDNVANYYYYESGGTANLPTGATDINATATNIFNNKNAANYGNAKDTYADAGWVEVEHTNGLGLSKILLPGSVVDMLNPTPTDVYYQMSDDGRKVRFIGVIDLSEEELLDYSEVGFDIAMVYEGGTYTYSNSTKRVYTSIMADGVAIPASMYGGTYFYVIEIKDLEAAISDVEFDVSGFIVTKGGETQNIYGNKTVNISANPLLSLPDMQGAIPYTVDTGDDCRMVNYGITSKTKYESYCADMIANGFTLYAENKIDENIYRTYVNDNYVVTTIYTEYNRMAKALIEPLSQTALPTKAENNIYTAVSGCETTITQLGQYHPDDYDETYNGMCYIIRLADGSFIIVDGGVNTSKEKYEDRIYKTLKKQAPDPDNIVIAAWIFTHGHSDHVGIFEKFCKSYSDKVSVEQFIYNMPSSEQAGSTGSGDKVRVCVSTYYPDALKTKAHPGQVFYVRNAVIEMLYTLDLFEKLLSDFNNTSLVFTIETEGKKMMFLGDYAERADTLLSLYSAESLKCDIVQVAHHGILGTSNELYEKIAPTYAFWPGLRIYVRNNNQDLYSLAQNEYIVDLGDDNIFMADDNVYVFTFKNNSCVFYDSVAEYLSK